MKTIEEAAKEHSSKYCMDNSVHKSIFEAGFRICAKEFVQRWIPVEEEPPVSEFNFTDQLLTKNGALVMIQKGFKNPKNNKFKWCDETEISHWRPIEYK